MTYTPVILFTLATVGMLLHNLIKLDRINRKQDGNISLGKYLRLEKFSILISLIISGVSAFVLEHEIGQNLERFAKYFGTGFICLGYFAQSILIVIMGKAEKFVINQNKPDTDKPYL